MNHNHTLGTLALAAVAATAPAQVPFNFGNLVVVRVGDGTAPLTAAAAPIFLDEYTTSGALVQTLALPTAASGGNRAIAVRGSGTSEGFLSVATNGLSVLLTGYDAIPGATGFDAAAASLVNRIIARVEVFGFVDTSTALTDAYSSGNPRAVASDDGTRFWISGTSTSDGGVRYVANIGATTSLGLNAGAPSNCRVAGIYDSQLFVTSGSGSFIGINTVGTGLPTAPGQVIAVLPGFPGTGGTNAQSAYDFFFADQNTVYVADDNTTQSPTGGIQKWTFNGTTWTQQYTLQLAPATGVRGLTGFVQDGVATLWATANTSSAGGAATQLVTVTDTGPTSPVISLVTSPLNTAFRGLRHLALPSTLVRIPATCGTADIKVNGNGQLGTQVRTTVLNPVGFPLIAYGTVPIGVPICGCTFVHEFALLVGGPVSVLPIPNNPQFLGIGLLIQGVDFLAPGGCVGLPFTLTDAFSFTVQ